MARRTEAQVRVDFQELKEAFEFVIASSRSTLGMVTLTSSLNGLYLARAGSGTRLRAKGSWPGGAAFGAKMMLTKLELVHVPDKEIILKVIDSKLWIGEFVVDCEWTSEAAAVLTKPKRRTRRKG